MLWALGTAALAWTTLGFVVFVALFGVLAPWAKSVMGKHMMTFMSVCTAILLYALWANLTVAQPHPADVSRLWIRLIAYASLGAVAWWRVGLLIVAQAANLRQQRAATQHPSTERSTSMFDKYAKAIVGAIMAILTGLATALTDGHLSPTEVVTMAIVGLGALGIVWGVPNETGPTLRLQPTYPLIPTSGPAPTASMPTVP